MPHQGQACILSATGPRQRRHHHDGADHEDHAGREASWLALHPITGRTHQLRVHLAYIRCPIVGDSVYGTEKADRMYLHAEQLEVTLPGGVRKTFTSGIPESFAKMVRG